MPDPFAEPEFEERLRKLLRMLASDQEQEADTARRKLLQHLAGHGLSANDLADRLSGPPSGALEAAQAAVRHAEQRTARAEARLHRAEQAMTATRSATRPGRGARIAFGALLLAVPCAGLAAFLLFNTPADAPARRVAASAPPATPGSPAPAPAAGEDTAMFSTGGMVREVRQPAGWTGRVRMPGTELRSDLRPDAIVLALLGEGVRVTVLRAVSYGGAEWLQVNSQSGPGFVAVGNVRRED